MKGIRATHGDATVAFQDQLLEHLVRIRGRVSVKAGVKVRDRVRARAEVRFRARVRDMVRVRVRGERYG